MSALEKYMKKKAAGALKSTGPNIPKKAGAKELDADIPQSEGGGDAPKLTDKKKKKPAYLENC